jgi:hypothetical protein
MTAPDPHPIYTQLLAERPLSDLLANPAEQPNPPGNQQSASSATDTWSPPSSR